MKSVKTGLKVCKNSGVVIPYQLIPFLRDIETITPYYKNPKSHKTVARLVVSIRKHGFNVPITVDINGVIITGHGRLIAAIELGMTKVPVMVMDHLTDEEIKTYRISDNTAGEESTWDEENRRSELLTLKEMGADLSATGYTLEEIDCLLDPVDINCLDDLDINAICGNIEQIKPKKKGREEVYIRVGEYKYPVIMPVYEKWLRGITDSVGFETESVMGVVLDRLGITSERDNFNKGKRKRRAIIIRKRD
jgi:ParB/Sulfiredoxin domain